MYKRKHNTKLCHSSSPKYIVKIIIHSFAKNKDVHFVCREFCKHNSIPKKSNQH